MDLDLLLGVGRFLLATTLLLLLTVPTAFVVIQMELKVIAQMQLRYGPNRIGPFFAIIGLSVGGMLVAGWASYNKYSLLGGLRSAAQMVSYEIPLTLSGGGVVVLGGSLTFREG